MVARICVVVVLVLGLVVAGGRGVSAVEEGECDSAYNYLPGCLTFVQGPDVVPNAVCCGGIEELNSINPGCLCTIILELGDNHNVNVTKAYALPITCRVNVDLLKCPALVLPPGAALPPSIPPGLYSPVPGDLAAAWRIASPRMSVIAAVLAGVLAVLRI